MEPIVIDKVIHPLYMPHGGANVNKVQDLKVARQGIAKLEALVEEQDQAIKHFR